MKKLSLLLLFTTSMAFADRVCLKEWIWGGCALWTTTSELSGGGGGSSGAWDEIYYKNECSRPIQTAIHYRDFNNQWSTQGWFTLQPGDTKLVANTPNGLFYAYAESVNAENVRLRWSHNDKYFSVRGQGSYGFQQVRTNPNQFVRYTYRFSCDGIPRYNYVALAWSGNGSSSTQSGNSMVEAENRAMTDCQNRGGTGCAIGNRLNGGSFACIAVSKTGNSLAASSGSSFNEANNAALNHCRNSYPQTAGGCQVAYTVCNNS